MAGRDPRRRGREWITLGHGIRMPASDAGARVSELRHWQAVLPGSAVFAGLTAAQVHGLALPERAADLPTFAAAGTEAGEVMPARPQLIVARHPTPPAYVLVGGVRVQTVEETILESARWLASLDLIALIDSAVNAGKVTTRRLEVTSRRRRRGNRMLRYALGLADGRAESPWETYLRLLHVSAGIAVTPQVDLFGRDRRHIARADLLIDGTQTVHEYDGAHHRTPEQHRKDLRRDAERAFNGYVKRGFAAPDLLFRPARILTFAHHAIGEPMSSKAPSAWGRMLAESMLTASGMEALEARLEGRRPQLRVA